MAANFFFLCCYFAALAFLEGVSSSPIQVDPFKATFVPNYQACLNETALAFQYCNVSLSTEDRIQSLIDELTLDEKISLISPNPQYGACDCPITPIPRLGLPGYMYLVETNTGVASACYAENQCASTFNGPTGLGAAFNRSLWYQKGDVISTELRAFSNAQWYRADGSTPFGYYKIGFDGFGPNINIVRDPRFGRNSELPSEDPYLTGSYAINYVQGMQQVDANGYLKMAAFLKHYTAYSTETNRMHSNFNISMFDFWDTYLPQYEMAMTTGEASGVMCSYAAENGIPSCANNYILNEVMRGMWDRPDALVMTDCGAISNMLGAPLNAPNATYASAYAINNGTDIEAGDNFWSTGSLAAAVAQNLTTESVIDASVSRALLPLFKAGRFDPPENVAWTQINVSEVLNSTAHNEILYQAAVQSFVLLKNDGVLPLKAGSNIAVVGPQAVSQYSLLSDYFGDEVCYYPGETPNNKYYGCITSLASAVSAVNVGGTTSSAAGVDINSSNATGVSAALALVDAADFVILALGIDKSIESEGQDRVNITLPGLQEPFAQMVLAKGKPTALVLVNGGALAIDTLMTGPNAIVEAFYPSVNGAVALADTLFGLQNRWGKLPITIYPADYVNQVDLTNFDMSFPPGRTYRYYTGDPLFPFGFGLSYTEFVHSCFLLDSAEMNFNFTCSVSNIGPVGGDEVILVYHSAGSDIRSAVVHPVPLKQLVQFERVTLTEGSETTVQFSLDETALQLTNAAGEKVVYAGTHTFIFSRGHGTDSVISIVI